jgi:hypothetical protein
VYSSPLVNDLYEFQHENPQNQVEIFSFVWRSYSNVTVKKWPFSTPLNFVEDDLQVTRYYEIEVTLSLKFLKQQRKIST